MYMISLSYYISKFHPNKKDQSWLIMGSLIFRPHKSISLQPLGLGLRTFQPKSRYRERGQTMDQEIPGIGARKMKRG